MSTLIFYYIPKIIIISQIKLLNAFLIYKDKEDIRLHDVRKFPIPGEYHFRFKFKFQ